ncbi:MAG: twin-arginine translocase TatA/TatE family subunit [Muribaculaceae bacterium]|nr:twin-arginine translocase TatA/TatE family subunit [Muribaculaceae bacterium]
MIQEAILLLFGNLGSTELIIIVFVVLLLFGGKKIPELMKGLGKGVRSFKQGMNDIEEEIKRPTGEANNNEPSDTH